MKNNLLLLALTTSIIIFINSAALSQIPNYGAAGNFVFFTTAGAITANSSVSHITGGDVGTNSGAITTFENTTMTGVFHIGDAITAQAVIDLRAAFDTLETRVSTTPPHATSFGAGETLPPGVYSLAGATSIAGNLILDGQHNPNSIFIFLVSGGAFTSGTGSSITLINGASACNVVWAINGAISFAGSSNMMGTFISNNGAFSMAGGSTLVGRAYSTSGALSVTSVSVTIPKECADFIATIWTGVNTDWNNGNNWNNFIVPTAATKLTIPVNINNLYPVINTSNDTVQNIIIKTGASLTIAAGGTLHLSGSINDSGTLDASMGTIEFRGISPQTIAAQTFLNNTVKNLIISNNQVNLLGQQNVTGTLSFGNSNDTLYTNDNLVLKSTATATALIADITNGGTLSANTIIGNVSIERYIGAKRAWRLLSTPIVSGSVSTINNAWQEGATSTDPNPGYGTQITGGSVANGYDQGINSFSSIKIFNPINNSLQNLPSTGTNTALTANPAYFIFVRGNRSTNLLQGTGAALSPTILRMKGSINTGDTVIQINAANFTLVGNPYPAPINFHTLTKVNVPDNMYVWDPYLVGSSGVGGYVTFSWNSGKGSYDSTQSVSPVSRYIQSGEAFFVNSNGIAGTLTFSEINKNAGGSDQVFRELGTTKDASLRVNLFDTNADSTIYLTDGVLTTYNDANTNLVDNNDALKLYNSAENICIGREGKNLAIERRLTITGNDTTFFNLYRLKKQAYKLQFKAEGFNPLGFHAILKDKYLGTLKDTALNTSGTTEIAFKVNTDSASFASDRFSIVFNQEKQVLPFAFLKVNAINEQKDINLGWTVSNEFKIKSYVVEYSKDGITFMDAATILPTDNTGNTASYFWLDKSITTGLHIYRVKCIGTDGKISYSAIVNITIPGNNNEKFIRVNNNVVNTGEVAVYLHNIDKGSYTLKIYSMDGELYDQFNYDHAGDINVHNFTINNRIPSGIYQLILSNTLISYRTSFVKE